MKRVVILGAGTGGTLLAHKLTRELGGDWRITVVDQDDAHIYQPGLLLLPFGTYRKKDLVRSRRALLPPEAQFVQKAVSGIRPDENRIDFEDNTTLSYDLLVVALGAHLNPDATEGLTAPGCKKNVFDFYTLEGAQRLQHRLARWSGGRVVVNLAELPIKCPVAPLEFAFLLEAFTAQQNTRDATEIVFATPLDGAFTQPIASASLEGLLSSRGIHLESNFLVSLVDSDAGRLSSYDGRILDFDLLVSVPAHEGAPFLRGSTLADELGFIKVDKHSLQSTLYENVFAIGDCSDVPTSKAGSAAHFMGKTLTQNVIRAAHGQSPLQTYDGHVNCFIETGYEKGLMVDFNYETQPLKGNYPLPGIGPFSLLKESAANHWGKLAFKWIYWHLLLPGHELPIDDVMSRAGKVAA